MELKSVFRHYQLVFVGGGISCTHTLLALLDKLKSESRSIPLSVLVIEKSPHFWTGIAFGPRSSKKALSITTLDEFVHPREKSGFLKWLKTNILQTVLDLYKNDFQNQDWVESNREKIEKNEFENLYFPRYLYGKYLEERLNLELQVLKSQGKIRLNTYQAEVINLYKIGEEYSISMKNPAGVVSSVMAGKLILCMGYQGRRSVLPPNGNYGKHYVSDPYYPSMDQNLKTLKHKLEKPDLHPKNVLIIGSNATALELLYLIKSDKDLIGKIDKLVVLSPSGTLPFPIRENACLEYAFPFLEELKRSDILSAENLMLSIIQECDEIKKSKINLGDLYYRFSEKVVSLLKLLSEEERKTFHDHYGMVFTRLIRRAGSDYSGAVPILKKTHQLILLKGKIQDIKKTPLEKTQEDQYILTYKPKENSLTYPETFISVFNCAGFEGLEESQNPLIQNILSKNICKVNPSNRGFLVNDQLEGNKNLYVMGPLLGSLFISSHQYWHVENSKRIHELSYKLAEHLLEPIPVPTEKPEPTRLVKTY